MPDVNLPLPFDAYAGEEPFVFVSYAHKDGHLVYPEINALHDSGIRIWFDGGIDPGNEWPEEIAQALLKAKMFLVFITPSAVESKNVRKEINYAINKKKSFLAVHLQETQLPAGLELMMGDIQAILKYRMIKESYNKKLLSTFPKVVVGEKKKPKIEMGSPGSKKKQGNDETQDGGTPAPPKFFNYQEFIKNLNKKLSENVSLKDCWNNIKKLDKKLVESRSFWIAFLKLSLFFLFAQWTTQEVKIFIFEPTHDTSILSGCFYIGVCIIVWRYTIRNGLDLIKIIRTKGVKPTILLLSVLVLLGLYTDVFSTIILVTFIVLAYFRNYFTANQKKKVV